MEAGTGILLPMKGKLILAEHATAHPDGTFSMLKAGIDRIQAAKIPAPFKATLVVRIEPEVADQGEHTFDIRCMDADGKQVLKAQKGQFQAPPGGGAINLILGMAGSFPAIGDFSFYLRIDNVEVDSWTVHVVAAKKSDT